MGAEAARNEENRRTRQAAAERSLGDARSFGVFDTAGCPKCGCGKIVKKCCDGAKPLEDEKGHGCPILGEHLHCWCGTPPSNLMIQTGTVSADGCSWCWIESTKDA